MFRIFGARISTLQIAIVVIAALIMGGLLAVVHKTRLGTAMRATAQNREVAGLMGVNINTVISAAFLIGSALAAVAGMMVATYYGVSQYTMGFMLGLKAFTAAVLGGIGNLVGAMAGGLLLGIIESLGAGYIGDLTGGFLGSHYQDVFAFFVLVLVLIFRPSGLLGERVGTAHERDHEKSGLSTRNLIGIALIGIVLAVLPFVIGMAGQSWVRILNFALLYVMLSLGLNIVVGFAGLLDLGYIAFYAVGAYAWAMLASPHFGLHLPFWAILPIALAVACLFGACCWGAHAQAARRLPGHRDLGLRRDHPHLPEQPELAGQHHQRSAGHQPHRHLQGGRVRVRSHRNADGHTLHRPGKVLLPAAGADADHRGGVPAPAELAHRRAPGKPSARTRSRPRPWASTPATSSCWPSPWARPSAAWPARCSPSMQGFVSPETSR